MKLRRRKKPAYDFVNPRTGEIVGDAPFVVAPRYREQRPMRRTRTTSDRQTMAQLGFILIVAVMGLGFVLSQ